MEAVGVPEGGLTAYPGGLGTRRQLEPEPGQTVPQAGLAGLPKRQGGMEGLDRLEAAAVRVEEVSSGARAGEDCLQ